MVVAYLVPLVFFYQEVYVQPVQQTHFQQVEQLQHANHVKIVQHVMQQTDNAPNAQQVNTSTMVYVQIVPMVPFQ